MSVTLASPFVVLPATLLSGLLLALMIARLSQGEFSLALFRAGASLGVVMGLLILVAEAPFNLQANVRVISPVVSAFVFAGFPEEAVKFAAVFFFLRPHYLARTHRALVLAAAAVGLGFALTEDVLYIAKAGDQWGATAAVRALSAAIVVVVVTTISTSIGSFASGMFAVFPIVMACTAVILQLRVGGVASASMFAHAQIALNGLWLGFLAMHYLVAPIGVGPAYGLGLLVCIGWSGLLWAMRRRRRSPI